MRIKNLTSLIAGAILIASCSQNNIELLPDENFNKIIDGKEVSLYTLKSQTDSPIFMQVSNYGCRIVSLWTPDNKGKYADVVLGRRTIDEYINYEGERFLGPIVGPVANRIAGGKFSVEENTYLLPQNNNGQTLHGGESGLDLLVWDVVSSTDSSVVMTLNRQKGLDGFPGDIHVQVEYVLDYHNELIINYKATSDEATPVNLSNHAVFNLRGEGNGTITEHQLQIFADYITPVDSLLIPTGQFMPVQDTPFDFRQMHAIGDMIDFEDEQLANGAGYDHNWVLDRKGEGVQIAAILYEPESGRQMEIYTDQPGLQFYSGNFFKSDSKGKYGSTHNYREGLALETQNFPDAVNQPNFPESVILPGEEYSQTSIYKFSVRE